MFVYREEYYLNKRSQSAKSMSSEDIYNIRHDEWLSRLQSAENRAEIMVAANVMDPQARFKYIEKQFTHFTDLTDTTKLPEEF